MWAEPRSCECSGDYQGQGRPRRIGTWASETVFTPACTGIAFSLSIAPVTDNHFYPVFQPIHITTFQSLRDGVKTAYKTNFRTRWTIGFNASTDVVLVFLDVMTPDLNNAHSHVHPTYTSTPISSKRGGLHRTHRRRIRVLVG